MVNIWHKRKLKALKDIKEEVKDMRRRVNIIETTWKRSRARAKEDRAFQSRNYVKLCSGVTPPCMY